MYNVHCMNGSVHSVHSSMHMLLMYMPLCLHYSMLHCMHVGYGQSLFFCSPLSVKQNKTLMEKWNCLFPRFHAAIFPLAFFCFTPDGLKKKRVCSSVACVIPHCIICCCIYCTWLHGSKCMCTSCCSAYKCNGILHVLSSAYITCLCIDYIQYISAYITCLCIDCIQYISAYITCHCIHGSCGGITNG